MRAAVHFCIAIDRAFVHSVVIANGDTRAMTKTADPIAAHMIEVADARDAGCCDADILLLQYISDSIVLFAGRMADAANKMSDGRMRTHHCGLGVRRAQMKFDPVDVAERIAESVFGDLDAYGVIRTGMPLFDAAASARAFRKPIQTSGLDNLLQFAGARS
jgi:hypothetical protein